MNSLKSLVSLLLCPMYYPSQIQSFFIATNMKQNFRNTSMIEHQTFTQRQFHRSRSAYQAWLRKCQALNRQCEPGLTPPACEPVLRLLVLRSSSKENSVSVTELLQADTNIIEHYQVILVCLNNHLENIYALLLLL